MTYEAHKFSIGQLQPGIKKALRTVTVPLSIADLAQDFDITQLRIFAAAKATYNNPHPEILRFLRYCKQYGFTHVEIANYLHVNKGRIARWCIDYHIKRPKQRDPIDRRLKKTYRKLPSKPKDYTK